MRPRRAVRRASVVIAVTLQRLLENPNRSWAPEEELVLEALRRSKSSLADASSEQLAEYVANLEPEQLSGVINNVKGIYHELLFVRAENTDGDGTLARVFEETNHSGADVEFTVDGATIGEVQLKATFAVASIAEHLRRYPDVDILATAEIASLPHGIASSGFANEAMTDDVTDVLDRLGEGAAFGGIRDGLGTSVLVSAAITAGKIAQRRNLSPGELRTVVRDVAVGGAAAVFLDAMLEGLS